MYPDVEQEHAHHAAFVQGGERFQFHLSGWGRSTEFGSSLIELIFSVQAPWSKSLQAWRSVRSGKEGERD